MPHANMMSLSFIESEIWATKVYIAEIGIFRLFCSCDFDFDPMTFICELDLVLVLVLVLVLPGHTPDMQTSYRKAFERYRLTNTRTDRQVTCSHFRSRDTDGGHRIIQSTVVENPMIRANLMARSFI